MKNCQKNTDSVFIFTANKMPTRRKKNKNSMSRNVFHFPTCDEFEQCCHFNAPLRKIKIHFKFKRTRQSCLTLPRECCIFKWTRAIESPSPIINASHCILTKPKKCCDFSILTKPFLVIFIVYKIVQTFKFFSNFCYQGRLSCHFLLKTNKRSPHFLSRNDKFNDEIL